MPAQRVSERLALASTFLPQGVVPYLAPDATALGQIFWYTVEGEGQDLGRLRAIQDWNVRYQLNSVPGVAQVASVGGYPIEYQIDVDPLKLRAYGITLGELYSAVERSNSSVGGRVIHKGNAEYLVRGVGWITSKRDIEQIVIKTAAATGTPITVANLATVGLGTQFRRSVLEKNGNETVGGVVMMRYGENPLEVTRRIKDKIVELQPGLPEGVRIVPFYDRTRLIHGAIHTLTEVLTHEMIIASLAVLLILMHFRSALVICLTLPLSVLVSFILMRTFDIASNIMSLSGIAISIGILVDQAIVMVENATHHLTAHFDDRRRDGRYPRAGDPGLPHRGPADFLFGDDHPDFVHPGVCTDGPRGENVSSAGVHQELCDDRRGDSVDHARPGADSHLHSRPAAARRRELASPHADRHLQAGAELGDAAPQHRSMAVRGAIDPWSGSVSAQCAAWEFPGQPPTSSYSRW